MNDRSLSMNAKNVKIIARDGKITLKGPVVCTANRTPGQGRYPRVEEELTTKLLPPACSFWF
jgi:hypothetical protein